ncbi:MAG: class I SAM-dependent RNA methyltransferase, partial [Blastocatellia bacterium]
MSIQQKGQKERGQPRWRCLAAASIIGTMTIRSGDLIEVKTERLAYGGDAVARHGKMVLFVPYAAPDEAVRVRVTTVKKTFARAVIEEVVTPSPVRRTPECRYFGVCGGCQLQHIDYAAQLKSKAGFIRDSLARLGHIDWPREIEVEGSPEFGYRTRAQIKIQDTSALRSASGSSSDKLLIGFNRHGSHSVCDVESCPILEPRLNSALGELRTLLAARTPAGSEQLPTEVEIAAGDASVSFAPQFGALPDGPVSRTIDGVSYRFTPRVFFQSNAFLLKRLVSEAVGSQSGN